MMLKCVVPLVSGTDEAWNWVGSSCMSGYERNVFNLFNFAILVYLRLNRFDEFLSKL